MYDKKIINIILCYVLCLSYGLSSSSSVFASDPDNIALNSGDKAPYAGVLLPTARAQRVDVLNLSYQSCQKIGTLKDDENALLTQRLANAQTENKELADKASSSEWKEIGAFTLGLLTSIGMAFAVSHVTK